MAYKSSVKFWPEGAEPRNDLRFLLFSPQAGRFYQINYKYFFYQVKIFSGGKTLFYLSNFSVKLAGKFCHELATLHWLKHTSLKETCPKA
jgi:hypothetical protein